MAPSFETFDNSAWDYGVELYDKWQNSLYRRDVCHDIGLLIMKHHQRRDGIELAGPRRGAFNVNYKMRFADDSAMMIRFPMPAYFQCLDEKLLAEVAVMRLAADKTTIPLPLVQYHGKRHECPAHLDPLMITDWVDNAEDMCDPLNTPGLGTNVRPNLDSTIDVEKLGATYGEMADVLLQLSRCNFDAIGSFGFREDDEYEAVVAGRPLSLNMVQLGNFACVPHFELPSPSKTFATST